MSYFKRRNLVDQIPSMQRNRFLKFITLLLLGASASMLLANADLVINPQVSNSSAYMKQFFITSDGTSNSPVGALLQGSGVFSKTFCNLSGTACKTIEELFAIDSQLANLLPADNGQYTLYASGGKILTGGLRTTVAGYSLPTKLAIGFVTPSNALDVLGSAYISGSVQVMGSLVSSVLTGVATINGINMGEFVTLTVMDARGYLTGSQVDARIALQINALSGVITSTYYTAAQVDAKGYLTGSALTPYYTAAQVDAKGYLTGSALTPYYTAAQVDTKLAPYYTAAQVDAKGYLTGSALANSGNWNTAYSWGNHATQGYITLAALANYVTNAQTGNWNTAYSWGNHATQGYLTGTINALARASLSCINGQVPQYNGTSWGCATISGGGGSESDPTVPSYVKSISSNNIIDWNYGYQWTKNTGSRVNTLATTNLNCKTGKTVVYSGSSWTCVVMGEDVLLPNYSTTTQITAMGYITGGYVNSLAKASLACTNGQVPQYNGTSWSCVTLAGGGGITVESDPTVPSHVKSISSEEVAERNYGYNYVKNFQNNSLFSLGKVQATNQCTNGQVAQWNGSDWTCATVAGGGGVGMTTTANTIPLSNGSSLVNSVITQSGNNIGIGVANPGSYKLNVQGSSLFNGFTAFDGSTLFTIGENVNAFTIYHGVDASNAFTVDGDNRNVVSAYPVGIGTNGFLLGKLDVQSNNNAHFVVDTYAGAPFLKAVDDGANNDIPMFFGSDYFSFLGGYTTFSSNIGIGIAGAPVYAVDVNGTGNFSAGIRSPRYCNAAGGNCFNSTTISNIPFNYVVRNSPSINNKIDLYDPSASVGYTRIQSYVDDNGSQSTLALNPEDGNVGIGTTSPNQRLEVNGTATSSAVQSNISAYVGNGIRLGGGGVDSQVGMMYSAGGGGGAGMAFRRGSSFDTYLDFYTNNTSTAGAITRAMTIDNMSRVGIGTATPSQTLEVNGTGLFTNSVFAYAFLYNSDRRLKTNIVNITDPLEKINQLNGYTFDWKSDGRHDIGVIAQEVESVFPEAVVTKDNGFKTVNYPSLVAPIIEAVKSLYAKYIDQQAQIDTLKAQVAELKTIVEKIK